MLRIVVVGMGAIGHACAQAVRAEGEYKLVGLLDEHPERQGKSLSATIGIETDRAVSESAPNYNGEPVVTGDVDEAVSGGADVAIVATSSRMEKVVPTIRPLLGRKIAVISSCEELTWPWYRHPFLADQLDTEATRMGRAVLGTGVNPGFVMDRLVVTLSSMVRRVKAVRCVRRVDASIRRKSLLAKIGVTLAPDEFDERSAAGRVGLAGMGESVAMVAAGLGRSVKYGTVRQKLAPIIAENATPSRLGLIQAGQVCGMRSLASWKGSNLRVELDLTLAVGLQEQADEVTIDGPVRLKVNISGGLPGDSATVAALLNHIRVVHEARPGLRTMLDVPPAGCHNLDIPIDALG